MPASTRGGTRGELLRPMRDLWDRFFARVPQNGTPPSPPGNPDSSVVEAPAYLFRDVRRLNVVDLAVNFLRNPNPISRRAKWAVQAMFRAEMPALPIYRVLAGERFARQ